ncbi:MAG: hypothetical protein JWR49_3803, partial [Tardiphaga sp.]|nr:hypothetical protein [Tardiphaga sp.]
MQEARRRSPKLQAGSWTAATGTPHYSMSARLKNPQRVGISAYYIESKQAGAA